MRKFRNSRNLKVNFDLLKTGHRDSDGNRIADPEIHVERRQLDKYA